LFGGDAGPQHPHYFLQTTSPPFNPTRLWMRSGAKEHGSMANVKAAVGQMCENYLQMAGENDSTRPRPWSSADLHKRAGGLSCNSAIIHPPDRHSVIQAISHSVI